MGPNPFIWYHHSNGLLFARADEESLQDCLTLITPSQPKFELHRNRGSEDKGDQSQVSNLPPSTTGEPSLGPAVPDATINPTLCLEVVTLLANQEGERTCRGNTEIACMSIALSMVLLWKAHVVKQEIEGGMRRNLMEPQLLKKLEYRSIKGEVDQRISSQGFDSAPARYQGIFLK